MPTKCPVCGHETQEGDKKCQGCKEVLQAISDVHMVVQIPPLRIQFVDNQPQQQLNLPFVDA